LRLKLDKRPTLTEFGGDVWAAVLTRLSDAAGYSTEEKEEA